VLVAVGVAATTVATCWPSGSSSAGCAPGEHPLWSSFVWRNELADTFLEVIAASVVRTRALGTPVLNVWLRTLGARIGHGVWCDTYWLPEPDLVDPAGRCHRQPGCVVQTHLFHDRVLSMDPSPSAKGAPSDRTRSSCRPPIGRHATVGPVSLVMRGEGCPIDPVDRQTRHRMP
jgi:non-ribosomal peptide synthetase-like protein